MSYDLTFYVSDIDNSIIPKWLAEFEKFNLKCEIHPDTNLDDQSGFLPFKVKILKSKILELLNRDYISGYEMYISEYYHEEFIKEINEMKIKRQSFIDKLFKKKIKREEEEFPEGIELILKQAKKEICLNIGYSQTLEIIMAWYSGAILINLLGGVIFDPQTGEYFDKESAIIQARKVFEELEGLGFEKWKLTEFEGWL